MKNSKEKQELLNSIQAMEEIFNNPEVPKEYRDSIAPSLKNAKQQLSDLERAETQHESAVKAEKKVATSASKTVKKQKSLAKNKAAIKVKVAKKKATKKLKGIKSVIKKVQAGLTKIKGRTARGKESDASRKAKPPGKRVSASGNIYTEHRENRADLQKKKMPYLEEGGAIGEAAVVEMIDTPEQVNVFGYETKYLPVAVVDEFKKAIVSIDREEDKDSMYFHNTSEALREFAQTVDSIFLDLANYNLKMVIASSFWAGMYNYKSGLTVNIDVVVDCMENVLKENDKYFAKGGRIKSATNRDRAYKSDEPWEQAYERKTRPRNPRYAELGAKVSGKEYKKIYDQVWDFYDELDAISKELHGEDRKAITSAQKYLEKALQDDDQSYLFITVIENIEWLHDHPFHDLDAEKQVTDSIYKVQKSLRGFKWFIYDVRSEKIIAVFIDTKDANKFVKELEKGSPEEVLNGYSAAHLKKIGKDPLHSSSWSDSIASEELAGKGGAYYTDHIYKIKLGDKNFLSDAGGFPYFYNEETARQKMKLFAGENPKMIQAKPKFALFDDTEKQPLFYFDSKADAMKWWKSPTSGQEIRPVETILDKAFLGMTLINSADNLLIANSQAGAL